MKLLFRQFTFVWLVIAALSATAQTPPANTTTTSSTTSSTPTEKPSNTSNQPSQKTKPFSLSDMLWIIGLCGLMGGLLNYRRTVEQLQTTIPALDDTEVDTGNPKLQPATNDERRRYLLTCLTAGVVAAALVPLFLNSLSSKLLEDRTALNLLIFAGFCLIAGVSSNAFIDALTQRILNQIKTIKQQTAEDAKKAQDNRKETERVLESARAETQVMRIERQISNPASGEIMRMESFSVRDTSVFVGSTFREFRQHMRSLIVQQIADQGSAKPTATILDTDTLRVDLSLKDDQIRQLAQPFTQIAERYKAGLTITEGDCLGQESVSNCMQLMADTVQLKDRFSFFVVKTGIQNLTGQPPHWQDIGDGALLTDDLHLSSPQLLSLAGRLEFVARQYKPTATLSRQDIASADPKKVSDLVALINKKAA